MSIEYAPKQETYEDISSVVETYVDSEADRFGHGLATNNERIFDNLFITTPEGGDYFSEAFYRRLDFTHQAFANSTVAQHSIKELALAKPNRLDKITEVLIEEYAHINQDNQEAEAVAEQAAAYLGIAGSEKADEELAENEMAARRIAADFRSNGYLSRPVAFEIAYRISMPGKYNGKELAQAMSASRDLLRGNHKSMHSYQDPYSDKYETANNATEQSLETALANIPSDITTNAMCRDAEPDTFFPEQGRSAMSRAAKRICGYCAVREQCGQYALDHNIPYGIWGGMTPNDREDMRNSS